jgi:hypothetical protein
VKRGTFLVLVALVCAVLYAGIRDLPFFSEDFTQLLEKSRLASVWQSVDLHLDPLRPFQHLSYYLLGRCAEPDPAWLRALSILLHAGSVLLLARLARALGADEREARLAGALYLVFPCVKVLIWGAAISNPLRVFFVLAALVAFAERRTWLVCGSFVLALLSYECAIVLPVLFVLLALARGERERLVEPRFRACVLITLGYIAYVYLRPQRHDELKPLDSIPANLVKASLAVAPEPLRTFCIEGLRGHLSTGLLVLALALFAGWLALGGWAFLRGGPALRFVVLAIACDLLLPVIGAGFVQRYACLAGAFAAIGAVFAVRRLKPRLRTAVLAACFLAWADDTLRDCLEYREAGDFQQRVLAQLREERERAGPAILAVIGLPDMAGRERDLPLFNWGTEECIRRAGIPGPWVFWRTREFATGTDVPLLPHGHLALLREQGVRVLWFHPEDANLPLPLRALPE